MFVGIKNLVINSWVFVDIKERAVVVIIVLFLLLFTVFPLLWKKVRHGPHSGKMVFLYVKGDRFKVLKCVDGRGIG